MENQNMENAVVVLDGIEYDASGSTPETQALIADLATVQTEMQKLKISYDIAGIARQSLLGNIQAAVSTGESGLQPIKKEAEETEEDASALG